MMDEEDIDGHIIVVLRVIFSEFIFLTKLDLFINDGHNQYFIFLFFKISY